MDHGSAEDPCRCGACQEISGDLTSKRDTLTACQNSPKSNMFLKTALVESPVERIRIESRHGRPQGTTRDDVSYVCSL